MEHISKKFTDIKPITQFLYEQQSNAELNEGVLDWVKKTYTYLKQQITRCGEYFVALIKGEIAPVIMPITGQLAFMRGLVKNAQVGMIGTKQDKKFSGISTDPQTILNKRPSTIEALKQARLRLGESQEEKFDWSLINEEYLDEDFINSNYVTEMITLDHPDTKTFAKLNVDTKALSQAIKVSILKPTSKPLMIWGAPGIGKTAIVNAVLKELKGENARLIDLPLATMTEDELFLPDYKLDENGNKVGVRSLPHTYFPVYLPTGNKEEDTQLDAQCGTGVIFFDELSRAKPQMMNVCLKLIHERKLGEYVIGSGWSIISASNRFEDDPNTNHELSTALGNRFRQVNYSPTFNSWRAWAEKQGYISQDILNWLELNEKYFYMLDDGADYMQILFPSPRSWDIACQTLADYVETGILEGFDVFEMWRHDRDTVEQVIAQSVGSEAASGFMEYLDLKSQVDIEKLKLVWTNPSKAPLPEKKGKGYRLDSGYIFITTIASFMPNMPNAKQFDNICEYLIRLDDASLMTRMFDLMILMYGDPFHMKFSDSNDADADFMASLDKVENHYEDMNGTDFSTYFGK